MWWKNKFPIHKITVVLLLISTTVYFYLNNPAEKGVGISCFFYQITHFLCPGCGGQRAFHALLHGHLWEAFQWNCLIFLILPLIFLKFLEELTEIKIPKKYFSVYQKITGIIALLFGIFRNFM